MKREYGFYWVMISSVWVVGEWSNIIGLDIWQLPGYSELMEDFEFCQINENRITPPVS